MKSDRLYLMHILESIDRILSYAQEGREAFLGDVRTQDAVVRNFEIIGEAAKRVTEETRKAASDISWRRIAGFRDVLIHRYEAVDPEEVWSVVERDLPDLKRKIEAILEQSGGPA